MIQDLIDRSMFHFTSMSLAHFSPENRLIMAFARATYDIGALRAIDRVATYALPPDANLQIPFAAAFSEFRSRAQLSTQLRSVTLESKP